MLTNLVTQTSKQFRSQTIRGVMALYTDDIQ